MAVRGFSDRRTPVAVPRRELRNKLALMHHITVEHGAAIPESGQGDGDVAHAWLRWHHDVMHDSDTHVMNVPHEH